MEDGQSWVGRGGSRVGRGGLWEGKGSGRGGLRDGRRGLGVDGEGWGWKGRGEGRGVHTVSFDHIHASATTDIARVPPLHGQQFKHLRLPTLPGVNWRFVSLWILSLFQNIIIFIKAIAPVVFVTMGHVLRLGNRTMVYSEVRYRYLILKSKKRVRGQRKCNFMSLFLMFIKYATSYQLKLIDKRDAHKNQLFLAKMAWVPSTDKLSIDLREDHLKMYARYRIRYRNHDSFVRFSLLLSGDV